jgi:hypothetical protein
MFPDGTVGNDHVLPAIPGSPGYTGTWRIVLATPDVAFDVADMPYTSVDEVLTGVAAWRLVPRVPAVTSSAPSSEARDGG